MREIRLYGSEGGGAVRSPYPYPKWSGSVGPLSPCAGFLLERPDLEFFHSSASGKGGGRSQPGWSSVLIRNPSQGLMADALPRGDYDFHTLGATREQGWPLRTLFRNNLNVDLHTVRGSSAEVADSTACARQTQSQSHPCRFCPETLAFAADMVDPFGQKPSTDKPSSGTNTRPEGPLGAFRFIQLNHGHSSSGDGSFPFRVPRCVRTLRYV